MQTQVQFSDHASLHGVSNFDSPKDLYLRLALPLHPQNSSSPRSKSIFAYLWMLRSFFLALPNDGFSLWYVTRNGSAFGSGLQEPLPGNPFYKVSRIKELSSAAINFMIRSSHKDGTCDDYFPYERAMGALVFSLYAASEAYLILGMNDQEIANFLSKGYGTWKKRMRAADWETIKLWQP